MVSDLDSSAGEYASPAKQKSSTATWGFSSATSRRTTRLKQLPPRRAVYATSHADFRPLGSLNRARRVIDHLSAVARHASTVSPFST
jgi:hypothetical protein